ncbi:hypothetical protein TSAR_006038 [Trichomalopsis sarcophagae]|uniref:Uncharacterized protein n=1 Tax=Trichomalopsis sarcophagae TaxID=543379 RepID=A0A232FF76_9HYME|nr:hypothetical protein TSAR_006038 [Trichomalopsis sarcophagae]
MESFWSRRPNHMRYFEEGELALYLKTAGTVLLGWIIVSSIWHIVLVLFAPAAVSALAVFLICPTTLQWFFTQLGPTFESTTSALVEKFDLAAINMMDLPFK